MAIGELADAGVADAIGVSAIAFGGSCGPPVSARVTVTCSLGVPSVVVVVLVMLVVVPRCVLFF